MATTFIATAEYNSNASNSGACNKPTGTVDNDIMFALVSHESDYTTTIPSGWTSLGQNTFGVGEKIELFYKIAASEGSSYTWATTNSARFRIVISTYRGGFLVSSPIDVVSNTAYTAGNTNVRAASMTTTAANEAVITWAVVQRSLTTSFTAPSTLSMVEDYDSWDTAPDVALSISSGEKTTAGATGDIDTVASASLSSVKHAFAVALTPPPTGQIAPVLRGTPTEYSSVASTSGATAMPTGVVDGDIMFAVVQHRTVYSNSSPSGWTLLGQGSGGASNGQFELWYRVASSESGGSYTWGFASSERVRIVITAYQGGSFDTSNPIDVVSNTGYTTNNTIARAASISAAAVDSQVFHFACVFSTTSTTFSPPTSPITLTEDYDSGSTTPDFWNGISSGLLTSSGSTGDIDGTLSVSRSTKHTFAVILNPAPTGGINVTPSANTATFTIPSYRVFTNTEKRYWVGGTANWDATAGSKWALTSGGAGGASVPTYDTQVFFDGNSGSGTVTVSATANLASLDCSGFTGTLAGSSNLQLWNGGFTLGSGMTYTHSGLLFLVPIAFTTVAIVSNGKTLTSNLILGQSANPNGTFSFSDAFVCSHASGFKMQYGTLTTNNFAITSTVFSVPSPNGATLNMGSSTWTITGSGTGVNAPWNLSATGITVNAGTSTIKFTDTSATGKAFGGGSYTYYNLWFSGSSSGAFTISGSNTFNDLKVDPLNTVNFTAGTTQTVASLTASGTSGNVVTLQSTSSGSAWTISKPSGTVSLSYATIKDSTATGGATWEAFTSNNNTDNGGNTGWNFSGTANVTATPSVVTATFTIGAYTLNEVVFLNTGDVSGSSQSYNNNGNFLMVGTTSTTNNVTGVTYNGVSMTQIGATQTNAAGRYAQTWVLSNPAQGSNTLAISGGTSHDGAILSLGNVDTNLPYENVGAASGNSGSASLAIKATVKGSYVVGFGFNSNTGTAGANTTVIGTPSYRAFYRQTSPTTGYATKTLAFTMTSNQWNFVGAVINPSLSLATNLEAYWKMDESSGNAIDTINSLALVNNNTVSYGTGKKNNGADFGSSNTNKYFKAANDLSINGGAISISAWVNVTTAPTSGNGMRLVYHGDSTSMVNEFIMYQNSGGTLQLYFNRLLTGSSNDGFTYNVTLTTGTWFHVALTYDGTTIRGYVNGSLVGSSTSTGTAGGDPTYYDGIVVATNHNNSAEFLSGKLDEIFIHSRALTATEVAAVRDLAGADVTVSAAVKTLTFSLPSSTVSATRTVTVSGTVVTATFTLPAETVVTSATLAPSVQTATFSIPTYTVSVAGSITATPSAQVCTFTLPASTVSATRFVTVSGTLQTATFTIPAYSAGSQNDTTATPSAQVVSFTIPAYTVVVAVTVAPSVKTVTFSIPAETITSTVTVAVAVKTVTFSTQTPTISVTNTILVTPAVQLLTFSILTYLARGDFWQEKFPAGVSSFTDKVYNASNNWGDKFGAAGNPWSDKF